MNGLVLLQPDKQSERQAQARKLSVSVLERPAITEDLTLIAGPGIGIPWGLVSAGFGFVEKWEAAAPLWRYGVLASDVGTSEERAITETLTLDLRVPLYECGLLFVRKCEGGQRLLDAWLEECERGEDRRLAFLRALCRVKPLFLALPRSWLVEATVLSEPKRVVADTEKPGLVLLEVGPRRFIRCQPEEVEMYRERFAPKSRRRVSG